MWKDATLAMLKRGRSPAGSEERHKGWNKLLSNILGDSPNYPSADGEGRSCLEIKIHDNQIAA